MREQRKSEYNRKVAGKAFYENDIGNELFGNNKEKIKA